MTKLWAYIGLIGLFIIRHPEKNTYYISTSGDDNNNGLSVATAWRTIGKLNTIILKSGETVLFEGGKVFDGTIILDSLDGGTRTNPLTISSYGNQRAIINAADNRGLWAYNCAGIRVKKLVFNGSGVTTNKQNGIEFYTDYQFKSLSFIEIDSCEVKGFHGYGIVIIGDKSDTSGYRDVKITHNIAHENGEAGIGSLAKYPAIPHKNFYLAHNKAHHNKGILGKTYNHSGNGIVMAGIDGLLIEKCEAYENGADNRCAGGGPVGIWLWMCKNGIIQECESHHNHAGLTKDGGGFDIDGGSSDCIIRACYSHDNEGAGYLLAQFDCPLKFSNNKIINNISRNDGLKNNYGSITFWGANETNKVVNSEVSGNKCYVTARNIVNGKPCGLRLSGNHFKGIKVINNYFEIYKEGQYIYADENVNPDGVYLKNNIVKNK
ncbi:right-handed parallel beta-helix repeat-containing protein [Emticicia sp. 17c]|uniref:right-handed parallel beta-helix repeat-containing protein n=1 Tax=Emticicia sp. 17c TaxID=3127704 RepID=UPI00301BCACD